MAFRLLFWRRPKPESAGRHVRAMALPVPDSTGALASPLSPPESAPERSTGELGTEGRPAEEHGVDLDATAPVPVVVTPVSSQSDADDPRADQAPLVEPAPVEAAPFEAPPGEAPPVEALPVPLPVPVPLPLPVEAVLVQPGLVEPLPVEPLPVEPVPVEPVLASALPVEPVPVVAGVALGFADGASVELHPDDPRVTSFRAAAAALLDPHGA